jgi:hypothetical protein
MFHHTAQNGALLASVVEVKMYLRKWEENMEAIRDQHAHNIKSENLKGRGHFRGPKSRKRDYEKEQN